MTTNGTERRRPQWGDGSLTLEPGAARKFVHAFILAASALIYLLMPTGVLAQTSGTDLTYTFGQTATFQLASSPDRSLKSGELYLQVNGNHTESYVATLSGATLTVTRDLASTPLPPFGHISYWWAYTTSDGTSEETEKQTFDYVDNRYTWQTAEGEGVNVHWITGETALMVQALDVAESALSNIQASLEAPPARTTDVYIYPSQVDLASAMQLAGYNWVGGVTYPELGVVLVAVPPDGDGLLAIKQDIPHELTHRVLFDMLGAQGYAGLPTWLDEGLATNFEERPDPTRALALQQATSLIPMSELCAPFPDDPERAQLAYAESASLVTYLRQTYGWSSLRALISAYADGKACNTGVRDVLGMDLGQLEHAWRVWLEQSESTQPASDTSTALAEAALLWHDAGPWLMLLAALLLPGLLFFVVARR